MVDNKLALNFLEMIKSGKNPQQLMLEFLENKASATPMGANLLNLAKNDKTAEIEMIARNIAKQRGIDFDTEFTAFKKLLGFK
jgi:hypothetical protein